MFTYERTVVSKNALLEDSYLPDEPIKSYLFTKTYVLVKEKKKERHTLDFTKMLATLPNLDWDMSVKTFVEGKLTDLLLNRYRTNHVPMSDDKTRYRNRIESYEALSNPSMKVSYTLISRPTVRDDPYMKSSLNDLVLTDPARDFSNSLVTVNGVFHRTVLWENELFVDGGYFNIKNNKKMFPRVGVYDTTSIGGHKTYPISFENIPGFDIEKDLESGLYLTFPGVNFSEKTLMLVIYGYLFFYGETFKLVNKNTIKIDLNKIDFTNLFLHNPNTVYYKTWDPTKGPADQGVWEPIIKRPPVLEMMYHYFKNIYPYRMRNNEPHASMYEYNFNSLYSDTDKIENNIPADELQKDAFIYKLITNSHSFLIELNNPSVYVRRYPLTNMASSYLHQIYSDDTPRGLLRYGRSFVFPYVVLSGAVRPKDFLPEVRQHTFSIDYLKRPLDVYKTAQEYKAIPTPLLDVKSDEARYSVELYELYSYDRDLDKIK